MLKMWTPYVRNQSTTVRYEAFMRACVNLTDNPPGGAKLPVNLVSDPFSAVNMANLSSQPVLYLGAARAIVPVISTAAR